MFFALLKEIREHNMTTPEETRDRIKKMRDRIFKEPDEVPLENNSGQTPQWVKKEPGKDLVENNGNETLQEKELPAEKTKVVQKDEISSKMAKPTNLQETLKQTVINYHYLVKKRRDRSLK